MKLKCLTFAASAAAASLLLADDSSSAQLTPFEDLSVEATDWFATSADVMGSGTWKIGTTALPSFTGMTTVVGGETCAEVDSDEDMPLSYVAPTVNSSSEIESVTVRISATTVPTGVSSEGIGGKLGFGIFQSGNARVYKAWLGSSWVELAGTPPAEGALYDLTVTIDQRDGVRQARFQVGETVLKNGNSDWCPFDTSFAIGSLTARFSGCGYFRQMVGQTWDVTAEKINIAPGSSIVIAEAAVRTFRTAAGATTDLATYLKQTNAANGTSHLDNYVLFGKADPAAVAADDKVAVTGSAAGSTADTIGISVPKLNVPEEMKAKVSYALLGSRDGQSFSVVEGVSSTTGSFDIPLSKVGTASGQFLFFKVRATVQY